MIAALVGLIAAATVLVEGGPGTAEAFSDVERAAVRFAVVRAEQILGQLAQAFSPNHFLQCSFFNEFHSVQINPGFIPPPTNTTADRPRRDSEIASREPHWRIPAMAALGFPTPVGAPDPVDRFCDELLLKDWGVPQKPRGAFVIFVTKFPTGWLAYARGTKDSSGLMLGGNQLTIQFDWIVDTSGNFQGTGDSGRGVENLDRYIAHEIGHLFGGLDEYDPCIPTQKAGPPPGTTNDNCVTGNPTGSVDCLMKHNSVSLCPSSVTHLGWVDANLDGAVDSAPPQVTQMSATAGSGGDLITLLGTGLGETRSVVFTGVGAADFTIVADTRLDIIVPDGEGTDIDVFILTALGLSSPSAALRFTYIP